MNEEIDKLPFPKTAKTLGGIITSNDGMSKESEGKLRELIEKQRKSIKDLNKYKL
jgi:hypothetical protein